MSLKDYVLSALDPTSGIWAAVAEAEAAPTRTIRRREASKTIRSTNRLQVRPRVMAPTGVTLAGPSEPGGLPPDYELHDKLGEGGMGVVYLARQTSVDRLIAVKMLKPDVAKDDEVRNRFMAEATVTGELDHPNIVPIHDLGCNESGSLFYAMKRVRGTPWSDVISTKTLTENLEILMRLADAISFAHSRGIIHRDIKPENVMLGDFGEVLVMDWGLAYSVSGDRAPLQDPSEVMAGTPAYMAPEMAAGTIDQLNFTSDVYLLGATLYEIITGYPPHSGNNVMGCLFNAAQNLIHPTSKSGELVEIARRAMSTRSEERFATVADFQSAIRDYQSHSESILLSAKATERLSTASRTGDYTDFAQALFGYREAVDLWSGNTAAKEGASKAAVAYAERAIDRDDLDLAISLLDDRDPAHVKIRQTAELRLRERNERQRRLRRYTFAAQSLGVAVMLILTVAVLWIRQEKVRADGLRVAAEISAENARDAQQLAEDREEQTKKALDQEKQALFARDIALTGQKVAATQAMSSARQASNAKIQAQAAEEQQKDQRYLAEVSLAGSKIAERSFRYATDMLKQSDASRRHYEWGRLMYVTQQTGHVVGTHPLRIDAVAVSQDGQRFVSGSWDGSAVVWSLGGERLATLQPAKEAERSYVYDVAFSPDGTRVATADLLGRVILWDSATGERLLDLDDLTQAGVAAHANGALCVTFLSDDEVISGGADGAVRRWNVRPSSMKESIPDRLLATYVHGSRVNDVAVSEDGQKIASAGQNKAVIIWDTQARKPLFTFRKHEEAVQTVAFARTVSGKTLPTLDQDEVPLDGSQVISAGDDRLVLVWDGNSGRVLQLLAGHDATVRSVTVSPDGLQLATAGNDNTARLWNLLTASEVQVFEGHSGWVSRVDFVPTANDLPTQLLTSSHDGEIRCWEEGADQEMLTLRNHLAGTEVLNGDFSPDGKLVATAGMDRTVKVSDALTGQFQYELVEGHSRPVGDVAISPDGRLVLTASSDGTACLWDLKSLCQVAVLTGHKGLVDTAQFSADGTRILTLSTSDRTARIWNTATGAEIASFSDPGIRDLREDRTGLTSAAFSADETALLLGTRIGRVVVQPIAGGEPKIMTGHRDVVTDVVALPGGEYAISSSLDRTCIFWNLSTGAEERPGLGHPNGVTSLSLSPDGKQLATSVISDPQVRIWDVSTRRRTAVQPSPANGSIGAIAWNADGSLVAVGSALGRVHVWNASTGEEKQQFVAATRAIRGLTFTRDGTRLLTAGESNVGIFDAVSGNRVGELNRSSPMMASLFVPGLSDSATQLVTCSAYQPAKLWDLATRRVLLRYESYPGEAHRHCAVSPDGQYVVTVDAVSDDLTLWERETGRLLGKKPMSEDEEVRSVAFSPDSQRFVATVNNTEAGIYCARVYQSKNGEMVSQFGGADEPGSHTAWVLTARFSPDGTRLMTGGADYAAKLWSVETGETLRTLDGHTAFVVDVAFSPDGRRVMTASEDDSAKLWDPISGQEILTLRGHEGPVVTVEFSQDGLRALTASHDGTARIWPAVDWRPDEATEGRIASRP